MMSMTAEALVVDYKTLSRWLDAPEREERDAEADGKGATTP